MNSKTSVIGTDSRNNMMFIACEVRFKKQTQFYRNLEGQAGNS